MNGKLLHQLNNHREGHFRGGLNKLFKSQAMIPSEFSFSNKSQARKEAEERSAEGSTEASKAEFQFLKKEIKKHRVDIEASEAAFPDTNTVGGARADAIVLSIPNPN